jgi:hypothetical protein
MRNFKNNFCEKKNLKTSRRPIEIIIKLGFHALAFMNIDLFFLMIIMTQKYMPTHFVRWYFPKVCHVLTPLH